ncbi:MAG: nucleotide exchange factor GrpE [Thermoleophilaceae bacterium]
MAAEHPNRDAPEREHASGTAGTSDGAEAERMPAQPDQAEPAGEQDPANEAERFVDADPAGPPSVEDEDELAVALRERGEYLALAQRTQADFENYRKRAARDAAAAGERAKSGLVRELLPVVDNLERALDSAAAAEQQVGDARPDEHLVDGVRLVHSELVAVLARNGVESFDPAGEQFDPDVHEALSMRSEDGCEAGVVLDVIEKGYRLNDGVLRPARVVVCG